jgi:aspartate/methionine/tyrosine aminotransferase
VPPHLAKRIGELRPFLVMEVAERAFAMERAGVRVDHLEIGEPGFPPPAAAVEACRRALAGGATRYTDSRGLAELRESICADLERRFGAAPSPDRVLVTSGTSPAMLLVFSLLLEPGDEVIVPTPWYPCYPNFIRYCGGVPVPVPTEARDGYHIDPDAVRRAITSRTRALVVSSPSNPTGAVQPEATLRALAELGIPLVSDEIYDGLVYDGARMTSALQVSEDAFALDGFSKRYAMTGFRLGWVVAPTWATRGLQTMQQNLFISANAFVQHAGIAALREGGATVREIRESCEKRRRRLAEGLRELGFGIPRLPEGALYVLADATRFSRDSLRLAFALLERAQVGAAPGIDFGDAGEGKLRFCHAVSEETIDSALERMARALPDLALP